jgi:hypothetical protein
LINPITNPAAALPVNGRPRLFKSPIKGKFRCDRIVVEEELLTPFPVVIAVIELETDDKVCKGL